MANSSSGRYRSKPQWYHLIYVRMVIITRIANVGEDEEKREPLRNVCEKSPRILEWAAYPFSRGSSQPRRWTGVSCITGGIFYQLNHQGRPRILEWVAYPVSRRSSRPSNRTGVSCIVSGLFTNWAMREALYWCSHYGKKKKNPLWSFLKKTNNGTTIWSRNFISGYLSQGNRNTHFKRHMHTRVHLSIIYRSQDMGITCVHWWTECTIMPARSFSQVRLSVTPWTAAHQAPLVCGIFQARVLERVAISSSRGSFPSRNQTRVSGIGRRLVTTAPPGKPPLNHKDWNLAICNNIDGTWGRYANWNKPDREKQVLHVVTYSWNLKIKAKWRPSSQC